LTKITANRFQATANYLGAAPANVLQTCKAELDAEGCFPLETKAKLSNIEADIEQFECEDEATAFARDCPLRIIDEERLTANVA
jgi:hypothetical protein